MSPEESAREKFVRLAQARTESVMDRLRVLGNLSNSYVYEFREEDVEQIFSTLEDRLAVERERFEERLRRRRERGEERSQPSRPRFELIP